MLRDMISYLPYLERIRERTLLAIDRIPPEQFHWSPRAGEFTIGDLVRHIASAEPMFIDASFGIGWRYQGHGAEQWGDTLEAARKKLDDVHQECIRRLKNADNDVLFSKQPDLAGNPISAWRILMLLIEHEIHHRSQLDCYLMLLGVEPPQVFGVKMESLPRD